MRKRLAYTFGCVVIAWVFLLICMFLIWMIYKISEVVHPAAGVAAFVTIILFVFGYMIALQMEDEDTSER